MKRILCLVFLVLLMGVFPLSGSESKIKEIRKRYNAISEKMKQEELQHHEIIFKTLVPGIGAQITTVRFYYEFLQDDETGDILESPLIKITLDYMIAASVSFYIEYLFNDAEELIFHYLKAEGLECGEKRFYFDQEKLIKIKISSLGEECVESNAGFVYENYERTKDFSKEDYAKAKKLVQKAHSYTEFFDEMEKIEQADK